MGNTSAAIFDAVLHSVPPAAGRVNPALPPELDHIISKLLEKDVDLRYQTAGDLRADLKRLHRDTSSGRSVAAAGAMTAARSVARPVAVTPARKSPWVAVSAIVAAIAVAGVTGYHFAARGKTSASPPVIVNAQGQAAPVATAPQASVPNGSDTPESPAPKSAIPPHPKPVSSATAAASKKINSLPAAPTPSKPTGTPAATPSPEPPVAATAPADTATTNTNNITKEGPCEKIKQAV